MEVWIADNGDALLGFAYLVTGDHDQAADAVQEALTAAYPRWSRITATGDPARYLRRCVINGRTSRWRRVLRHEHLTADLPAHADTHLNDHADMVVTVAEVQQLCQRLPLRQRAAIVLRYYDDLPDADIAQILGCSVSTVRSQIHHALQSLRRWATAEQETS
ncbi:hypothetical protein BAY61_05000 [Prauserella marina]|nr:hypothetical protein BAY61_05000 [Prauserella marina]